MLGGRRCFRLSWPRSRPGGDGIKAPDDIEFTHIIKGGIVCLALGRPVVKRDLPTHFNKSRIGSVRSQTLDRIKVGFVRVGRFKFWVDLESTSGGWFPLTGYNVADDGMVLITSGLKSEAPNASISLPTCG